MLHVDTFFHDYVKIFEEQVMRIKVVLVIDQVSNYSFDCSRLIISDSGIDGVSVTKLSFFNTSFTNLILEKDWVLIAKKCFVVIAEKNGH